MTTNANPTGEPKLASVASWAVLGASFGLSATTWIAMAVMAGFTETATLFGVTLRMAWLMPISVDGYVVVALVLWMSPVPAKVASFAKKNTYFAAGTGIAAQSAYHLLITASVTGEQWRIVMAALVGALPPTLAGLAIHMRALIRRESALAKKNLADALAPAPAAPQPVPAYIPVPATAVPSAPAYVPAAPMAPEPPMSTREIVPARTALAPVHAPVPTPEEVAPRIAPAPRVSTRTEPVTRPAAARPVRTRTTAPVSKAAPLDPSSTDSLIAATEAVQLVLPMLSPAQVQRARELIAEHLAVKGEPISAGTLAARLRIPSRDTAKLLVELGAAAPVPNVNGHKVTAL